MKQNGNRARNLWSCLALLTLLSGTSIRERSRDPKQDSVSLEELTKELEEESAIAELQVTLAGDLRDFNITTTGGGSQAPRHASQSEVAAAVAAYRDALTKDSASAVLHFDLSLALSKLGDVRGAQEEVETALRLDPTLAKARNQLGIWQLLKNEKSKAEDAFKAAITADSQSAIAKNNLGVLFASTGKDLAAIELFRAATRSRPDFVPAHVNLSLVLAGEGKLAEAEKEIRIALRNSPKSLSAYNSLGMIEFKLGRGDEAIEILQKVLRLLPNSPAAHLNLGMALSGDGFDLPGALDQFTEAIRLDPNSAAAHFNKGRVLFELNRFEDSRAELGAACVLQPDHVQALYL